MAPYFFKIVGISEILMLPSENFRTFGVGNKKVLTIIGKSLNLAHLLYTCHDDFVIIDTIITITTTIIIATKTITTSSIICIV